jgi:ATP-dependent Clp protease adaptor protein ClpS
MVLHVFAYDWSSVAFEQSRPTRVRMPMRAASRSERPGSTPTITRPDLDEELRQRLQQIPWYRVVVLDCQCHSFDDVEVALCRIIPGMTRAKAHEHAWEIHTSGASVVARAPKERAEHYAEQLGARGLRVTIEPD